MIRYLPIFLLALPLAAQPLDPRDDMPVTDGTVHAVREAGNTLYLAGDFNYVGPQTGSVAMIDPASGVVNTAFPALNGNVEVIIPDGAGGWYIGGDFTMAGGVARAGLVRVDSGYSVVTTFQADVTGNVHALALSGSDLFVGGEFTQIGGQARLNLARVDATSGTVAAYNPQPDGAVRAISVAAGSVYFGGAFQNVNSVVRECAAATDVSGALLAWYPRISNTVEAIEATVSSVYLCGSFLSIGGGASGHPVVARSGFAVVDPGTGASAAAFEDVGVLNAAKAMALDANRLYLAGGLSSVRYTKPNFGIFDTAGVPVTDSHSADDDVRVSIPDGAGGWYIGGIFTQVEGVARPGLARLDASGQLDTTFNPDLTGLNFTGVRALALDAGQLYIGGTYSGVGFLRRLNATSGVVDGSWGATLHGSANPIVNALQIVGGELFIGGLFTQVTTTVSGSQARESVASILISTQAITSTLTGLNTAGEVRAMATDGSRLFLGGHFIQVNGTFRNHLAAVTVATGAVTAWNPNPDNRVNALALDGSTLFAGGIFTALGAAPRTRIASFDLATLTLQALAPSPNNEVQSLASDGSFLYVGGRFTNISGQIRRCLARVDSTTGQVDAWNPMGNATDLFAISINAGEVFVGGATSYFSCLRNDFAVFDLATRQLLPFDPLVSGDCLAISLLGGNVYIGGDFETVAGSTRLRLAQLDTTGALQGLQTALSGACRTLYADATQLLAGGSFKSAGGGLRQNLAAINRSSRNLDAWTPVGAPVSYSMVVDATNVYVGGATGASFDRTSAAAGAWAPVTDGVIHSLQIQAGTVYLGGTFQFLSRYARSHFALMDPSTAVVNNSFPSAPASADAAIPDGSGGWYVGGSNFLVHYLSNGALDPNFNATIAGGYVGCLVLDGGTLYLGGSFSEVNGQARQRLAAIDAATGTVGTWNPGASSFVSQLYVFGGRLYALGGFSTIAGQARNDVASFDLSTGNLTSWAPDPNGTPTALTFDGTWLYLGGGFTTVSGASAMHICQISPNSNTPSSWAMDAPNDLVRGLTVVGTTLYACGDFDMVGSQPRGHLAAYDITGQTLTSWAPSADLPVNTLTALGSTIYVGGAFTQVQGQARPRLAALDASTAALTSWNPSMLSGTVDRLVNDGSVIAVVGSFSGGLGGTPRSSIAATDTAGATLGWSVDVDGPVFATEISATRFYFGGTFTQVAGQARSGLAAVDPATAALDSFHPDVTGGAVLALELDGADLHLGGWFLLVGGVARTGLATVDAASGAVGSMNTGFGHSVVTIAANQGLLYVGGVFTWFGTSSGGIVLTDAATGSLQPGLPPVPDRTETLIEDGAGGYFVVEYRSYAPAGQTYRLRRIRAAGTYDTNFEVFANGAIEAMVLEGTKLYVGGNFTSIGGQAKTRLARIDADSVSSTYGDVETPHFSANNTVYALATDGTRLYVGGSFSQLSGTTCRGFGAFLLSNMSLTGVALGTQALNSSASVRALRVAGGIVYVGGTFTTAGGATRSNAAAWDIAGGNWTGWAPQVNGTVYCLWLDGLTAYIGGTFTQVGTSTRAYAAAINADSSSGQFSQPTFWAPSIDGNVLDIRVSGTEVLLAGSFGNVNGVFFGGAAVLDSATANLTAWRQTFNSTCEIMLPAGANYLVAGRFGLTEIEAIDNLGSLNAATGVVTSWRPVVPDGSPRSILASGPSLFVGGSFSQIGDVPAANFAEFNTMPQISTPSPLPDVFEGLAYSGQFITASGGTAPYTWSIANGPAWLNINATTGELTGNVPAIATTTITFDITVTDQNSDTDMKTFAFDVIPVPAVSVVAAALANQYEGQPVTGLTIQAQGGAPPYQWSLQNAPAWLSIDVNTGQLTGNVPVGIAPVTITFDAVVTDLASQVDSQGFSFNVLAYSTPQITTTTLPDGYPSIAYGGVFVQATGGTTPYTWSLTGAPAWLSINPNSGELTGNVPAGATGTTVNFTAVVTDFYATIDTQALSIDIVSIPQPAITTTTLPNAVTGATYSATLQATGGTPAYTWTLLSGPSWLMLNQASGQLSGTPPAGMLGIFIVDVRVTDSFAPPQQASATLNLQIVDSTYVGSGDVWENKPNLNSGTGAPAGVFGPASVSTGTALFVWGGLTGGSSNTNQGGMYDPSTDSWLNLPNLNSGTGAPTAARSARAVWTGQYVIVWGGFTTGFNNRGGVYEPATDTWLSKPNLNLGLGAPAGRHNHNVVWTGRKLIVWSGSTNLGPLNTGGVYDPETDTWENKPALNNGTGAPLARSNTHCVWTGTRMLTWGGNDSNSVLLDDGGLYDPVTDTWSTPTGLQSGATNAPSARSGHVLAWTGTRMLVWGGAGLAGELDDGGIYNPATDTWQASFALGGAGRPQGRFGARFVIGSGLLIVWGGSSSGPSLNTGGVYDIAGDVWRSAPNLGNGVNSPGSNGVVSAGWLRERFVVWGGGQSGAYLNTGGSYLPPASGAAPPLPTVTVVASDPSAVEFAAGGATGAFTITLSPAPSTAVTIRYAVSGTADTTPVVDYDLTGVGVTFFPLTHTVVVPGGVSSVVVTVEPVDDTAVEPTETVIFTIVSDPSYTVGTPSSATVQIADNDSATAPDVNVLAGADIAEEGFATTQFEIGVSNIWPTPVTVNIEVSGSATPGVDFDMPGVTLTQAGSVWTGTVTVLAFTATEIITVVPIDDTLNEPDETIVVTIVAGTGYSITTPSTASLSIIDNEGGGGGGGGGGGEDEGCSTSDQTGSWLLLAIIAAVTLRARRPRKQ